MDQRKSTESKATHASYGILGTPLPGVFLELIENARGSTNLKGLSITETAAKVNRSRSGIWAAVKQGVFPPPIKVSARSVAWLESEVDALLAARRQISRSNQKVDLAAFVALLTAPTTSVTKK